MITGVHTETVCDMCGTHPTEVVRITPTVETDLCALHKQEFAWLISPYIRVGRVVTPLPPPTNTEIRQWAKLAMPHVRIKPSGRISQHIVEAYYAATRR